MPSPGGRSRGAFWYIVPAAMSLFSDITHLRLHHPDGMTPVIVGRARCRPSWPDLQGWLARRTVFLVTTPRVLALHGGRLEALRRAASGRWVVLEVEEGRGREDGPVGRAAVERDARRRRQARQPGDRLRRRQRRRPRRLRGGLLPARHRIRPDPHHPPRPGGRLDRRQDRGRPARRQEHGRAVPPPRMVVCDTAVLPTLPREELRSGLVEVVKMAALLDPDLFARVEERARPPARRRPGGARAGGRGRRGGEDRRRRARSRRSRATAGCSTSATPSATPSSRPAATPACATARRWATASSSRSAWPRSRGLEIELAARIHGLILARLGLPPLPGSTRRS